MIWPSPTQLVCAVVVQTRSFLPHVITMSGDALKELNTMQHKLIYTQNCRLSYDLLPINAAASIQKEGGTHAFRKSIWGVFLKEGMIILLGIAANKRVALVMPLFGGDWSIFASCQVCNGMRIARVDNMELAGVHVCARRRPRTRCL